jgi:hypothetical protein
MKNAVLFSFIFLSQTACKIVSSNNNDCKCAPNNLSISDSTSDSINNNDKLPRLVYDIKYAGENLYIQNPFSSMEAKTSCVTNVFVNDKELDLNFASAFEIDLSMFKENDSIHIEILHKKDCLPKVLNPIPKRPKKVKFESIEIIQK